MMVIVVLKNANNQVVADAPEVREEMMAAVGEAADQIKVEEVVKEMLEKIRQRAHLFLRRNHSQSTVTRLVRTRITTVTTDFPFNVQRGRNEKVSL